jgi:hypothetical protein
VTDEPRLSDLRDIRIAQPLEPFTIEITATVAPETIKRLLGMIHTKDEKRAYAHSRRRAARVRSRRRPGRRR